MEEPKVPPRRCFNERSKILVEQKIPVGDHFGGVAAKLELVGGTARQQGPGPDFGRDALAPKSGEGSDLGRVAHPGSGDTLGGRTLVGQEGDESVASKGLVCGTDSGLVVEDRGLVEATDVFEEELTRSLVGGASDSDGVGSEVVEDSGQPLPVAVMHGEEKCGASGLGPGRRDLAQGREVELVPSTRKEEDGFAQSVAEKLAGEVRRRLGEDASGEVGDFGLAGNGEPPAEGGGEGEERTLEQGRTEREVDHQSFEGSEGGCVGGHGEVRENLVREERAVGCVVSCSGPKRVGTSQLVKRGNV